MASSPSSQFKTKALCKFAYLTEVQAGWVSLGLGEKLKAAVDSNTPVDVRTKPRNHISRFDSRMWHQSTKKDLRRKGLPHVERGPPPGSCVWGAAAGTPQKTLAG